MIEMVFDIIEAYKKYHKYPRFIRWLLMRKYKKKALQIIESPIYSRDDLHDIIWTMVTVKETIGDTFLTPELDVSYKNGIARFNYRMSPIWFGRFEINVRVLDRIHVEINSGTIGRGLEMDSIGDGSATIAKRAKEMIELVAKECIRSI
jgi:hypothetical protein